MTSEEQPLPPLLPWQDMTDDNHAWPVVESHGDITGKPELPRRGSLKYTFHMLRVYEVVTAMDGLNLSRTRLRLPSNLHFKEWKALIESSANALIVDYLKFVFPTGYEGPVPTLATSNHLSLL